MSGKRSRKTKPRPQANRPAPEATQEPAPEARRSAGLFGGSFFASGDSPLPPIGRSLGRGMLAVISQPAIVVVIALLVLATWLALVAVGFEGSPSRLVDALALPPISTYFDLGTGASVFGIGPEFLIFTGISLLIRTLVYAVLSGMVLESLEDGRVSTYGVIRGLRAIPTVLAIQVLSFSLIVAGNLIFPVLGPGIGFLGFVAALVAGLFFLGFAPTAQMRQHRGSQESIRRSGRAAMMPGGRHLLFCSLYFFLALPVVVGFAPGASQITANPSLITWIFALAVNVGHVGFMAAFAYRWIVAEPAVPEEPIKRRQPARRLAARGARR